MDQLIEILQIFSRYNGSIGAEHDTILFQTELDIAEDDLNRLEELGVFYDLEYELWTYFV